MLSRLTSDRWLALGSMLVGLGGGAAVSLAVYAAQESSYDFWRWPAYASLGGLVIGVAMVVRGLLRAGAEQAASQIQVAGKNSTNLQAGRDLTISGDGRGDDG